MDGGTIRRGGLAASYLAEVSWHDEPLFTLGSDDEDLCLLAHKNISLLLLQTRAVFKTHEACSSDAHVCFEGGKHTEVKPF